MQKSSSKQTPKTASKQPQVPPKKGPKAIPLTFQAKVEKWFLPVMFVVVGGILVWTFVHASLVK